MAVGEAKSLAPACCPRRMQLAPIVKVAIVAVGLHWIAVRERVGSNLVTAEQLVVLLAIITKAERWLIRANPGWPR